MDPSGRRPRGRHRDSGCTGCVTADRRSSRRTTVRSRAPGPFGARTCRRQWSMAAPELFLIATPVLLIAVVGRRRGQFTGTLVLHVLAPLALSWVGAAEESTATLGATDARIW